MEKKDDDEPIADDPIISIKPSTKYKKDGILITWIFSLMSGFAISFFIWQKRKRSK
jgi:hypothetical protein